MPHSYFFLHSTLDKDLKTLRCDHRIVGAMAGSLEAQPLQNILYGMPLVLLPEEVYHLVNHGKNNLTWDTVDNTLSTH